MFLNLNNNYYIGIYNVSSSSINTTYYSVGTNKYSKYVKKIRK